MGAQDAADEGGIVEVDCAAQAEGGVDPDSGKYNFSANMLATYILYV